MSETATVSLLWNNQKAQTELPNPNTYIYNDLNLRRLVRSIALSPQYESYVKGILLHLTTDVTVIRYRQAILSDLLENPQLVAQLEVLLEEIIALEGYLAAPQWKENVLRQVAWRLSELQRYVETITSLYSVLDEVYNTLKSEGLKKLHTILKRTISSESFQQLKRELPELLPKIRDIRSVTIGINLDLDMRPLSATLLNTHTEPFINDSMLSRLLGVGKKEGQSSEQEIHNARSIKGLEPHKVELKDRRSPFMPPLFKDLSELMDETSRPIVRALKKYTQVNTQMLISLKMEIAFFLGAVKAIEQVREVGLPIVEPEILPIETRKMSVESLYNINLLFQQFNKTHNKTEIVGNNVDFDDTGRIFILTGPNQGGKTTYTQAVGLTQILAQAGLHVPAVKATISPVDTIYTHFATEEHPNLEAGRLGEEARRLNTIFQQATKHSLVLLNESLASTSASESYFLARDVIRAFRLLGVRAIFATHLHELAENCEEMNELTEGDSKIISVVSQVQISNEDGEIKRTYKIVPSPPNSKSYAIELAARFGISYEQLKKTIQR